MLLGLQQHMPIVMKAKLSKRSFKGKWFSLALAFVILSVPAGCSGLPFAQKTLPPETQVEPAAEPLPPSLPPPGAAPASPPLPVASPPAARTPDARLADLASQVEALRARLQAVEGKLAEQEHTLQQLNQAGTPQQGQMRDRILALERDLAAAQERLAQLEGRRAASAPKAESPAAPTPIREVAPPPVAPKPSGDPLQEGLSQYRQKSYSAAREHLQQYLKDHPKGDRAPEARFTLADSFLQEKKYDEAIVEFNKVVEGHPKSSYAPGALLKQSQAFKAQGKAKVANLVLEKLIADYPKSAEAAQARKLLGNRP